MDNITLDFEQAKTKHLLFKSRLRSILYGEVIDEAPILSHKECTVGIWIYSHALKEYGHFAEMQELEKIHTDIHTSARELVKLYKDGKVDEARAGLTQMENIADHLVKLLDELETKIKSDKTIDLERLQYAPVETVLKELQELAIANGKLDKIIKEQSGELFKERKLLHDFFMQAPAALCILKGKELVFELANKPYLELVGKKDLVGKSVYKVFPELKEQGLFDLLENVYNTKETFTGTEIPVKIHNNSSVKDLYVNFTYQAYTNAKDEVQGIMVFAYDVTVQVIARNKVEESKTKYKALSEELKHAYEDLEVKVKFRTMELEKQNLELQKELTQVKSKVK